VKTGSGSRLLLRTLRRSAVKLGEKGRALLGGMQMRENKRFSQRR